MIHCTIQRLKSLSWWDAIYLIWSYCSTMWKPIDIKTLAEFTTTNTTITLSTKTYHGSVQFSVNSAKCLHFWQPIWAQSNSLMPVRTIEIISPQSVESNSILKSKWNMEPFSLWPGLTKPARGVWCRLRLTMNGSWETISFNSNMKADLNLLQFPKICIIIQRPKIPFVDELIAVKFLSLKVARRVLSKCIGFYLMSK